MQISGLSAATGVISLIAAVGCQQLCRLLSLSKKQKEKKGLRVVCISDTHGRHREVNIPEGDVLIHAGDYTRYGSLEDAKDFNVWLGEQTRFKSIIVVEGNHEAQGPIAKKQVSLLSNATFLKNGVATIQVVVGEVRASLKLYGSAFYWPMSPSLYNPYEHIPDDCDVLVVHGPPEGQNDDKSGCPRLTKAALQLHPFAVVSGHVHDAYGESTDKFGTKYINAAMYNHGQALGREPIVFDI